ncbi:MAG: substrate-binding domain-containing protein [Caldilineales bacterium]
MQFRKGLTLLLLVVMVVLAACQTAAPVQQPAATQVPATQQEATQAPEAAEPAAGGEVTVGFVPPALTSPFHVAMVDGATAEAEAFGWNIDVQAPASEGDFQAFVTTVQQLLEKGVNAISINPIGTDSAITAVKAANEKGVPIWPTTSSPRSPRATWCPTSATTSGAAPRSWLRHRASCWPRNMAQLRLRPRARSTSCWG